MKRVINILTNPPRDPVETEVDTAAIELLKRALESIKINNEAYGGCDHSVGICNCADERLADEIAEFLSKGEQQ